MREGLGIHDTDVESREASMRFGQLMTARARKEFGCCHCGEIISPGVEYAGMIFNYKKEEKILSFTKRMHGECLFPWLETNKRERDQARVEKGGKRGRPPLNLTSEELRKRQYIQHNLWKHKERLETAYSKNNEKLVRLHWRGIAGKLVEYQAAGGTHYGLGIYITQYLANTPLYDKLAVCNKEIGSMVRVIREEFGVLEEVVSE